MAQQACTASSGWVVGTVARPVLRAASLVQMAATHGHELLEVLVARAAVL